MDSSTPSPKTSKVRFVCISDTHNHSPGEGYTLPKGDVLIHAGDLTNQGSYKELEKAAAWLARADFQVKIVIAGNHDICLDPSCGEDSASYEASRRLISSIPGIVYLQHESANIVLPAVDGNERSFRVFGSPHSPGLLSEHWAFQYLTERVGPESKSSSEDTTSALVTELEIWNDVPNDIDVLITHAPSAGHCDASAYWTHGGCSGLRHALGRIRPALHVCGHCHEGRGAQVLRWSDGGDEVEAVKVCEDTSVGTKKQCLFDLIGKRKGHALEIARETAVVNASIVAKSHNQGRKEFNKPIVVDINLPTRERSSSL